MSRRNFSRCRPLRGKQLFQMLDLMYKIEKECSPEHQDWKNRRSAALDVSHIDIEARRKRDLDRDIKKSYTYRLLSAGQKIE